jgi:hypothetical protein
MNYDIIYCWGTALDLLNFCLYNVDELDFS